MKWRSGLAVTMLIGISASAFGQVVVDTDDNAASFLGSWNTSNAILLYYGNDYQVAQGGGSIDSARFFSPTPIGTTGTWCIEARWTAAPNRTTAAQYQVFDGAVLRNTFSVNQRLNGGAWRLLGCILLTAGQTSEVRLSDTGVPAGNFVVADGVRWVWDPGAVPQDFCIAVNGGFGSGGTTFVGKGFVAPANGTCRPWSGIMQTATTVVGTSTGSACMSSNGLRLTVTLLTTNPGFLGSGMVASDHIELCPVAQQCPVVQADSGTFGGPAQRVACNPAIVPIPSQHD